MTQRDEVLVFARMMVTPILQIGNRQQFMSVQSQERYEALKKAFDNFVESGRADVREEIAMLTASDTQETKSVEPTE